MLVEQHEENLGTLIKHVIYNELSQTRNPNNMSMFAALFQFAPDKAAKVFSAVFFLQVSSLHLIFALLRRGYPSTTKLQRFFLQFLPYVFSLHRIFAMNSIKDWNDNSNTKAI